MRNVWKLFVSDLHRLVSNVVTIIIVLGLVFLPSIFSWYNILACWDVFDNTGNLKVAVANTDEGYESDFVAIRVNIGERVVSALRANDELDWVITDEADAVDGAMSGKYYAAVVIPPTFSADMMTFYDDDAQRADIVYYTNEKRSAIAPKVTDQGADRVAYQVNEAFTETLTRVTLSVLKSLSEHLDKADAQSTVAALANHLKTAGGQMSQASSALRAYAQVITSSQRLADSTADLFAQAGDAADEVAKSAGQGEQSLDLASKAFDETAKALKKAIAATEASYASLPGAIDAAYNSTGQLAESSTAALRAQVPLIDQNIAALSEASSNLSSMESIVPAQYQATIKSAKELLDGSIALQKDLKGKIEQSANDIESGNAAAQSDHEEARALAAQAKKSAETLSDSFETEIKPQMDELSSELSKLTSRLGQGAANLQSSIGDIKGTATSADDDLDAATAKLGAIADKLDSSSGDLNQLGAEIEKALALNDTEKVRELLSGDPEALAAALAAPVKLERTAVFPAENFGSQMAPLYTMLALWIGSLLLSVCIRVVVPQEDADKLCRPEHWQLFLGHFGVFALISFLQTSCMALGNMLFLGVQVNHPLLYLLCFWASGLVFSFIIYSLVATFANLGKAMAVLMLIVQVTGCNGAFPLQLLPSFIQNLSAWLPGTHTISAMRAAMFGLYENDYWIAMAKLLLFIIPAALIGLVLCKQLSKFMSWYIKRVESSKLMA